MGRRRVLAIAALLCLAALAAAGLAGGLVGGGAGRSGNSEAKPVNNAQAQLLTATRLANFRAGQAAVHAVIHAPGGDVHVTGWVDWRRPLISVNSGADQAGPADGLVQAVPGVVAVHAGRYPPLALQVGDKYPPPPATPPADGWRVRQMNPKPGGSAFDTLLSLVFSLAAPQRDERETASRFTVSRGQLDGQPVQVFSGPALPATAASPAPSSQTIPPPSTPAHSATAPPPVGRPASSRPAAPASSRPAAPPSTIAPSATASSTPSPSASASVMPPVTGTVQYWLDAAGTLRRVVASLGGQLPTQIDLSGTSGEPLLAVAALGGALVAPRPLTDAELTLLSRMRTRDHDSGGGSLTLTLPGDLGALTTGAGWLNWRDAVGYLALHDPDDPGEDQLARIDRAGILHRDGLAASAPPLQPPADGWRSSTWGSRGDAGGATDLDILLTQAVTVTGTRPDPPEDLRAHASFLRTDTLAGVPVLVIEVRQATEVGVVPGQGRLRYWLDRDGLLRRVELRTRQGGYGWLDITPAAVPVLPVPVAG
jgi:hypothetical protein